MSQENPIITRYLEDLASGLSRLTESERLAVVRDIRSHISEALRAGQPLDRVLGSLGAPDALARAYSVELLLKKPMAFKEPGHRVLRLAALILVGSIPTLVAVIALGVVGVVCIFTGLASFAAAQAALANALPWWISMDADPRLVMMVAPILFVFGGLCLGGLWLYMRLAAKVVTRILPPRSDVG